MATWPRRQEVEIAVAIRIPTPRLMDFSARLSSFAKSTRLPGAFQYVASRPKLAIGVVAMAALLECIAFAALRRPLPFVADEFSHLLAAETFASGRLTNPPHPVRRHLDSMSVIQEPTYQSKYPPAQGLAMAAGLVLGRNALVGVWLSFAVACGAVVWMIQAWLPPGWALLGGLLLVFNPVVIEFGAQYIGGAPAMLGGALLFGAVRRLVDVPRSRLAVPLATGLWLLAISRPFEGLVASLPAVSVVAVWVVRVRPSSRGALATRVVLWTGLLLALGFGWLGYYHYRVTGNPFVMPYQLHLAQTNDNNFAWQMSTGSGLHALATRVGENAAYLLGALAKVIEPVSAGAAVMLLLAVVLTADLWAAFALATFGLTLGAVCLTAGGQLRYLAPVVPLFFLLTARAAQSVWTRLGGWPVVRFVLAAVFIGWQGFYQWKVAAVWHTAGFGRLTYRDYGWIFDRARLVAPLEQGNGLHLVMVRTDPDALPETLSDWVHNGPNIDAQKVVWAWELEDSGPLFDYFGTREPWLLDLHDKPLRLEQAVRRAPQWTLRVHDALAARLVPLEDPQHTGLTRIEVGDGGGQARKVQVERLQPLVRAGASYTVSFRGRATAPQSIGVHVSQAHPPWANLGFAQEVALTPDWQVFSFRFDAVKDDDIVRLAFDIRSPGLLELADAVLARTDKQ